VTCPICANETEQKYRPFCSRRCADIDLAKWMSGTYAIPSETEEDAAEAIDALEAETRKPH
jgi:endogenous inhibitor of DNA gyrase (YacG/DUF329 family)